MDSSTSKDPPSFEEASYERSTRPDAGGHLPYRYEITEDDSLATWATRTEDVSLADSSAPTLASRTVNQDYESCKKGDNAEVETSAKMSSRNNDEAISIPSSAPDPGEHLSSELFNELTLAKQIQDGPVPAELLQETPIVPKPSAASIIVVSEAAPAPEPTPAAPAMDNQVSDVIVNFNNTGLSAGTPVAYAVYSQNNSQEEAQAQVTTTPSGERESTTPTPCFKSFARNRPAKLLLSLVVLLAIGGLVVGIIFGLGGGKAAENPPSLEQVKENIDGDVNSKHGTSVSLNGDGTRLAVAGTSSVQVFTTDDSDSFWVQMGSDIEAGSTFDPPATDLGVIRVPVVVDLSRDGTTVAIGWPLFDKNESNVLSRHLGKVEVYEWKPSGSWELLGDAMAGNSEEDYFGASVSLSEHGDTVAIGAPGNNGSVSVFQFNTGRWIERGDIIELNELFQNEITSVSLSKDGRILAIAGIVADEAQSVAARTFRLKSGHWQEIGSGLEGNLGGTAYVVALSGDGMTVAISNYYVSSTAAKASEANKNKEIDARAFRLSEDESHWRHLGANMHTFEPGEKSGYFITLSDDGKTIGMGDPGRREDGGGNTGHAHIYKYDGKNWNQLGPDVLGEAAGDQFGFAVSLSEDGNRFAIGAPFNRGEGIERGRVQVYELAKDQ